MAKGSIIGVVSGKLGNMVGYKVSNSNDAEKQGWRPYTAKIANPKSQGQRAQRAVFNTVSGAAAALNWLIDHSFEGLQGAGQNRNKFMALNLALLRQRADEGKPDFLLKGQSYLTQNPFIVSKGTLAPIKVTLNSELLVNNVPAVQTDIAVSEMTAVPANVFTSIMPGAQITVVFVDADNATEVYSPAGNGHTQQAFLHTFRARFTFDANSTKPAFVADGAEGVFKLNPDALNKELSLSWEGLRFKLVDGYLAISDPSTKRNVIMAAVIQSYRSGNYWKRSTQSLVILNTPIAEGGGFSIDDVDDSYSDVAVGQYPSDKYLNNSDK